MDYAGLHAWSLTEAETFYSRLGDFLGIGSKGATRPMRQVPTKSPPGSSPGAAKLSVAVPSGVVSVLARRTE